MTEPENACQADPPGKGNLVEEYRPLLASVLLFNHWSTSRMALDQPLALDQVFLGLHMKRVRIPKLQCGHAAMKKAR